MARDQRNRAKDSKTKIELNNKKLNKILIYNFYY